MNKKIMTAWQRLIGLMKLEKKDIIQIFYYAVFSGLVSLSLPLGIQAIINLMQGAQISTSWIVLVALVTIGVAFAGALQLMQMRIIETIQQRIFTRASFEFAYRFPKIKMSELRNYYPPELANRFFDTLTVQKGFTKILIDVPTTILQITFGLILLSFYHTFFIIYGISLLFLVYIVFKLTAQRGLETSLKESKNKYKVAHWIQEIARTVISFKSSGKTNLAITKNDSLVSDYLKARESHFKILMIQFIQMVGFKVLVTAGLLIVGGILVLNQEMNIGQFVAAEIIILLIISSVEKLILGLESFYDVLTSLEKIGQVVDKELENQEGVKPTFTAADFSVELDSVSYLVPDKEEHILQNINLKINTKSRILIQGESGSGKSSLLRVIAGIIEPTKGKMYVNSLSLNGISLNYYRGNLGLSLSEETPFEGSILENITFGDPSITEETVLWTLEKTGLIDFVKEQPKGLHTILYPEGKQMSNTVAKKIVLARAIAQKPKLIILEDPFDQFDAEEANRLITFLIDKKNPWGLVIVSKNRLWNSCCSTLVTLKSGKITG
ncbi:peptidase domain-containing ABC transporter [Aquimarina hainanensis]|uniref:Peptidase domain-containing ABC transporter n=1 Tax=Aquimarina hainanensis TaxID=1578017 RepID=A0ABW5NBJ0_9FLAO|nr:ATP-binding cassette domain-containing protein [Aquimarina sp. TRL1]QKX06701.1 ATP-binding cassette domain-containing protein [Aquimarina sp. TRL1]